jgi:hypothetical protein
MKSEMIRVSAKFADKLRKEHEQMLKNLERTGKEKELSIVQFTEICKVVPPTIVMPEPKRSKKKARIEEDYLSNIYKLI